MKHTKLRYILPLFGLAAADVPVSCPYSSTLGTWKFAVGTQGSDQSIVGQCGLDHLGAITKTYTFLLEERDQVTNLETGSKGTYTIVSSQGFEIYIDGRRWWAYYYFDEKNRDNNDCSRTMVGYQRDNLLRSWSCIQGVRVSEAVSEDAPSQISHDWQSMEGLLSRQYNQDPLFIERVNAKAQTWTAKDYPEFADYTLAEMQARQGFEVLDMAQNHRLGDMEKLEIARNLKFPDDVPTNWDWRNINGVRFDSPVWDQAGCGSCFAFASKSFMEARVRIMTNNVDQPVFSVQEMITCGANENYNQGCSGGFAYLVGGKQMYERGFVEESCDPENLSYQYVNRTCPVTNSCKRWYSSDYEYLGGYYGGATVDTMLQALHTDGPLSVGIAVPSDFRSYAKGVYYSTALESGWNPLKSTSHAVVIVGYGRCPENVQANDPNCNVGDDNLPYWIVKNSWGASWGEGGYIRVLMGVDEIYIESKPVVGHAIAHF